MARTLAEPSASRQACDGANMVPMNEKLEDIRATEIESDSELARYPDLAFARDYWARKRGHRFAPARADIDPLEITAILPRIMLADVEQDSEGRTGFRYRLSGTGIGEIHGVELTGRRPGDLRPAPYGRLVETHYREAVGRRSPLAHIIALQTNTKSRSYARIILPLSADGETVDMLMIVDSDTDNTLQEFLETIEALACHP
jgi:hypothetical protein